MEKVRKVVLVVGFLAAWYLLLTYWATPEECRGRAQRVESEFCQRLMYN